MSEELEVVHYEPGAVWRMSLNPERTHVTVWCRNVLTGEESSETFVWCRCAGDAKAHPEAVVSSREAWDILMALTRLMQAEVAAADLN